MTASPNAAAAAMPEPNPATATPGRRRPKLVDWRRAARLLADGQSPEQIAATLGIEEAHFWRHLRNSLRFQFYIRQARERRLLLGRLKLELVAGEAVLRCLTAAEALDPDSLRWATAQAGLAADADAPAGEGDLIAQLGATGRRKKPQPAVVADSPATEPTVETKQNEAPRRPATVLPLSAAPGAAPAMVPTATAEPPWSGVRAAAAPPGPSAGWPDELPRTLNARHLG